MLILYAASIIWSIVTATDHDNSTSSGNQTTYPITQHGWYVIRNELYSPWTSWSWCNVGDCSEYRHRRCRKKSLNKNVCPVILLVEKRPCLDKSICSYTRPAETLSSLSDSCGIRRLKNLVETKIIGGREAKAHSWPWQVGLYLTSRNGRTMNPFCSATLISSKWLITAGHCITSFIPNKLLPLDRAFDLEQTIGLRIIARLGNHHFQTKRAKMEQEIVVESTTLHAKYKQWEPAKGYDVALLKLKSPVSLDRFSIGTICIPEKNLTLPKNVTCFATGWGQRAPFNPYSQFSQQAFHRRQMQRRRDGLFEVDLPLQSLDTCRSVYPHLEENVHICAGEAGKDTCQGDSGAGLFCQNPSDRWRWNLYGVTSFGSRRGCGNSPGVYTSIPGVNPWIHEKLKAHRN